MTIPAARLRSGEATGTQCALLSDSSGVGKDGSSEQHANATTDEGWSRAVSSYSKLLHASPLFTKAASSGVLFGVSDWCAQELERLDAVDWPRVLTCALMGVLFGPAAHFWYGLMQHHFPRRRARDTLVKTILGQTVFGPCFTVAFFAATLCEQGGVGNVLQLPVKMRRDFLPTQLAGLGFWSSVDLVSYSCVVPRLGEAWIPLFASAANFIWTAYLSCVSARPLPAG